MGFNSAFKGLTCIPCRNKVKVHLITGHEGPEGEYRCSSTLSLTSALDGVGGQRHAPSALPTEKTWYPLYRRLGGPQGRCGRVRKISPPTEIRSPDRSALSESLYRLSCPGSHVGIQLIGLYCFTNLTHNSGICLNGSSFRERTLKATVQPSPVFIQVLP